MANEIPAYRFIRTNKFIWFWFAAALIASSCAAPSEIYPPGNPPSYVRIMKTVRLQADEEKIDTKIDLKEGEYVSIMASGKVLRGGEDEKEPKVWRLLAKWIDSSKNPLFSKVNGMTFHNIKNGRLYIGFSNFHESMARWPQWAAQHATSGHFDFLIVVWKTKDFGQIADFLEKLHQKEPKHPGIADALAYAKEIQANELARSETTAEIIATQKQMDELRAYKTGFAGAAAAEKEAQVSALQIRIMELTARLEKLDKTSRELKQEREKAAQFSEQLEGSGKMSVEEAKHIAVSMSDKTTLVPPRRIDDILATLNQSDQGYSAARQNLMAEIEKPPPSTENPAVLKAYYQRRGNALFQMGRNNQALADLRLAVEYSSRSGTNINDPQLLQILAMAEFGAGNFKNAIKYLEMAINLSDKEPGLYNALVKLHARVGDLSSAERNAKRGINLCKTLTGNWPLIHAAYMKAYVLDAQANFSEAESYYREVLRNWQLSMINRLPMSYALAKLYLARNLKNQRKLTEAELEIREYLKVVGSFDKSSEIFGHGLSELGEILIRQGRLRDAARLAHTSIRMLEAASTSPDSYIMADVRMRYGEILSAELRFNEAMQQFDFAKKDMQQNHYLYENYFARNPAMMLALIQTGRIEEAAKRISAVYTKSIYLFGEKHYLTGEILGLRGMVQTLQKNEQEALNDFSKAFPILFEQGSSEMLSYDQYIRRRIITESYLDLVLRQKQGKSEKEDGISASAEAFKIADALRSSAVQSAIGASTARSAATSPELADLIRREQDARKQIKILEVALTGNLAVTADQQLPEVIAELKEKIEKLTHARIALIDEINARFPNYADLTNPKPVSIFQVKNILHNNEAFVSIYSGNTSSYVWAIPPNGKFAFSIVQIDRERLSRIVAALRIALDPKPIFLGDIPEFDTAKAFELYSLLLKPVEEGWKGASDLLVVAHGPLEHLPFAVLATAPVRLGEDESELFSKYRKVPWLIRDVSLTRLPSSSTFVNLRGISAGNRGRRAFAGFGDPLFNLEQLAEVIKENEKAKITAAGTEDQIYIRGIRISDEGLLDNENIISCKIHQLNRLPDTSNEITSIAKALGADPEKDVFLGKRASERQVKSMDLSDRQVIAFATHALVPGDLDGLDQPALAFSSPTISGDSEDGLLTMEEILRLKLNADWVVLSACNTGAAEGKGAEALSGLGQAFFYAGTKSILVSLWSVETTSARELTTGLFSAQKSDQTLSRARALQKSALSLIDGLSLKDPETGKAVASYAHPLFWASFIIVGENGNNAN